MITPNDYTKAYLRLSDCQVELDEMDFINKLNDIIREKKLIHSDRLVPFIENLNEEWLSSHADRPGGFLDACKSFFPEAYTKYIKNYQL